MVCTVSPPLMGIIGVTTRTVVDAHMHIEPPPSTVVSVSVANTLQAPPSALHRLGDASGYNKRTTTHLSTSHGTVCRRGAPAVFVGALNVTVTLSEISDSAAAIMFRTAAQPTSVGRQSLMHTDAPLAEWKPGGQGVHTPAPAALTRPSYKAIGEQRLR